MTSAARSKPVGIGALVLSGGLCCAPSLAFAQGYDADLICQGERVTLTTRCSERSEPAYPSCWSEQFSFIDSKTGQSKEVPGAGALIRGGEGGTGERKVLDGLASGWTCAQGSKGWYVVVRYDNGGNCAHCEWYEIYSLQGKWLTQGARTNAHAFARVYRALGLPEHLDRPLTDIRWVP